MKTPNLTVFWNSTYCRGAT